MRKRLAQIAVLAACGLTMLGAGSPATRFDKLGHKLMCPCGCSEILLECNHVGCPDSDRMVSELHARLDLPPNPGTSQAATAGNTDSSVLNWFADKYGPTVLAAPLRGGFDLVAWIAPFAILLLGLVGIVWLLRHWQGRHPLASAAAPAPGVSPSPHHDAFRDRIRRETNLDL